MVTVGLMVVLVLVVAARVAAVVMIGMALMIVALVVVLVAVLCSQRRGALTGLEELSRCYRDKQRLIWGDHLGRSCCPPHTGMTRKGLKRPPQYFDLY